MSPESLRRNVEVVDTGSMSMMAGGLNQSKLLGGQAKSHGRDHCEKTVGLTAVFPEARAFFPQPGRDFPEVERCRAKARRAVCETNQMPQPPFYTILCHTEPTRIANVPPRRVGRPNQQSPTLQFVHAPKRSRFALSSVEVLFISGTKQTSAETLAGPDYHLLTCASPCFN